MFHSPSTGATGQPNYAQNEEHRGPYSEQYLLSKSKKAQPSEKGEILNRSQRREIPVRENSRQHRKTEEH
jgi:hypothetical protein